ncbi:Uncharacterised protein [Raoultella ornithinolytica]|nr:Uncharacterised protein [Raoultella ornithinolytica]
MLSEPFDQLFAVRLPFCGGAEGVYFKADVLSNI